MIATLRRLDIDCDLVERDSIYYTTRPEAADTLHAEHRLRRAAGFGGRWLGAAALRGSTGIDGAAGIRSRGSAQFDPYRACLGLMRAAQENGALVFERSAVCGIKTTRTGVAAMTRRGTVFANQAVIATGYATPEFKPLAGRFAMKHTYVLTSQRIAASARARLGLGDVMLWDTERPYHYARWTPDHRLILGGGDHPQVPERRRSLLFRKEIRTLAGVDRQHLYELLRAIALGDQGGARRDRGDRVVGSYRQHQPAGDGRRFIAIPSKLVVRSRSSGRRDSYPIRGWQHGRSPS